MNIITANRLNDGAVVYLDANGAWTSEITAAARFEKGDDAAALEQAQTRVGEYADIYLMEVDGAGAPAGRATVRETIRQNGPTVRRDLGYQAESNS